MPGLINREVTDSDSNDESESDDSHPQPPPPFNRYSRDSDSSRSNEDSNDDVKGNNSDAYLSYGSEIDKDQDISYENESQSNIGTTHRAAKYHDDKYIRTERTRS